VYFCNWYCCGVYPNGYLFEVEEVKMNTVKVLAILGGLGIGYLVGMNVQNGLCYMVKCSAYEKALSEEGTDTDIELAEYWERVCK